ncbi:unnamed protein product [Spirodela intermedia]|uniref:J domain-containing protein n=1 Tax=Spirodela intermedia TaxID=51605 RepID=A0A7I8J9S7_SPIIN|nr:unnamed protein product [Spirodela intermedia]CAA6666849.1 unnamed protein product [Spirodela intermedia]
MSYSRLVLLQISNFSTCCNLTLLLFWIFVAVLVFYINYLRLERPQFEPYSILGLEQGASDSEIKKAYRRLSIMYHPTKIQTQAHKHFVEFISKAYQALTDPVSRSNYAIYGHPDGRQVIFFLCLTSVLIEFGGASGGVILLGVVGIGILLPLIAAVVYLSRSSKYSGNYVMHNTLSAYDNLMKSSLAPRKVLNVLITASEYMEIPARRSDDEPLQKLFHAVRNELKLDPKNIKAEQAKFWKQHPALIKAELLIQAQLTRETAALPSYLRVDFRRVMELAPRLLEELFKISVMPRSPDAHGWLRPAIGVIELSQCIIQAVPLSARKAAGGSTEGIAPFLQLPHFSEDIVQKIALKQVHTLQDLQEMNLPERAALLTEAAGLSGPQENDVESVLEMMPTLTVELTCETEGEQEIQEGDLVTLCAWVTLRRRNGLTVALPHAPNFPFPKEENFWLLLADPASNEVWVSQKLNFSDEPAAAGAAGASAKEVGAAVKEAVGKVKAGSRLVVGKFLAPSEGSYELCCFCLCDAWIGCDWKSSLTLKVQKRRLPEEEAVEEEEEPEEEDEDYESEYSDDDDDDDDEQVQSKKAAKGKKSSGAD